MKTRMEEIREAIEASGEEVHAERAVDERELNLDETLAQDMHTLVDGQCRNLLGRWKHGPTVELRADLREAAARWTGGMAPERVRGYCAAVDAMLQSTLLDASAEGLDMEARIESLRVDPYVEVYAQEGSALARRLDPDAKDRNVRIYVGQIARAIAQYTGEPTVVCEVAWCALAAALPEALDVLPNVALRQSGGGTITARLRPPREPQVDWSKATALPRTNRGSGQGGSRR